MRESDWLTAVIQVFMAMFGALARILNKYEKMPMFRMFAELFVAGFIGSMLHWVTRGLKTEPGWAYAMAGIAGWIGPKALDWIADAVKKKTGIELGGTDPNKPDER